MPGGVFNDFLILNRNRIGMIIHIGSIQDKEMATDGEAAVYEFEQSVALSGNLE